MKTTIDTTGATTTTGNDNALARATPDTTALAVHAGFVDAVTGTLVKRGCPRRDLDDQVAEVQTQAIEAARRGPMPADLGEWKKLGATIAKRLVGRDQRKTKKRARYHVGLCGEPDECGPVPRVTLWDPVDRARTLAVLKELFDAGRMPAKGGEILWGVAEDVTQREIAEETGLTEWQVEYRVRRMRDVFRARLVELGLLEEGDHALALVEFAALTANDVVVATGIAGWAHAG